MATLCVYGQYREPLRAITAQLVLAGKGGAGGVFGPQGPAGVLALFPGTTQADDLRWVFLVRFEVVPEVWQDR